jgi:NADPH-dependent 7-cyano-7-deazaguanine reductase QueF-like protein
MIKFFRKIRQKLIGEKRFGKYLIYAIGEILLVVIGIIIAVSLGEWRQQVNDRNEVLSYYNNLALDLQEDKAQLLELIKVYKKSSLGLVSEIDKLQLDSYNQNTFYKGFSNWNVYSSSSKFKPQIAIYTEIVSNGRLKLIKDKSLKSQLLKLYNNSYPDLKFYQNNTSATIRNTSTTEFSNIFRWLLAFNNDGREITTIKLKNPLVQLSEDWLKNKQSEGFRIFENQLALRFAISSGYISRYKAAVNDIELLESEISKVLKKNKE